MYGGGFDMLAALPPRCCRSPCSRRGGWWARCRPGRTAGRPGGPAGASAARCGLLGARPAGDVPALYRPHVHECQGCALRGRHGDPAAGAGARVRTYPRSRPPTALTGGLGFGLSIGSRVMGGFGSRSWRARFAADPRAARAAACARRRAGSDAFVLALLPRSSCWPMRSWRWCGPGRWSIRSIRSARSRYFSHFFEKPWQELFAGGSSP